MDVTDAQIADSFTKQHYDPCMPEEKTFLDWGHEERRRNHLDHAAHIAGHFSNLNYCLINNRLKGSEDTLGTILIIGNQNLRVV